LKDKKSSRAFHIVTPCFNASKTIDQTIQSVISQPGNFLIHYHIQDGRSTDGTIKKLKKWEDILNRQVSGNRPTNITFTWSSKPDHGMYNAIIKGFDKMYISPDDFMTWINADDILLPNALSNVYNVTKELPEVQWIGGAKHIFDDNGVVYERFVPFSDDIIRKGLCDGIHWNYMQQEGIFFKKKLWFKSRHSLNKYKLAGDWNLWREMAHHTEYFQLGKPLGGFRRSEGQLSVFQRDDYKLEIDSAIPPDIRKESFSLLHKRTNLHYNLIKLENSTGKPVLKKEHLTLKNEFEKRWQKITKKS